MSKTIPHDDQRSATPTFSLRSPAIVGSSTANFNFQSLSNGSLKLDPMSNLTALNLDVLNYMMSVLPTADLSALMKTCKYLYEVALKPLCTRSFTPLNSEARVASFHRFLRIDSGPSSRAPFIKALWLDSENDEDTYLGILRHCHKVRRLLLGMWSEEIESSLILHVIATSLPSLEDFSLFITPAVTVTEKELRNLVQLPLRKFQLMGNMNSCPNALSAIVPLGRTLVELGPISFDTLRPPIGGSFPGVERLHVHFDHTDTFVETVTASFPGVTHLALLRCNTFIHLAVARNLRAQNRQRWQEASKSWRSLKAVWAADLCELYACGLARHTAHLSVPFTFDTTTTPMFMRDILADLRPNSLALRIQLGTLRDRPPLVQLLTAFEASLSSCVRLTLRLVTPAWATYDGAPAALLLDALENHLPQNGSLTHLLLLHVRSWGTALQPELVRIPALARASRSLRWIGFEAEGALRCWEVAQPRKGESTDQLAQEAVLVEMSECAGRRVLASEQIDEFGE
ncbi:hypothetical protein K466DRAFT_108544 [Polyporus arcularius HHB13444]|uniref:F-box domain-containing protein n=1 Tax=Polyporus arcularius HHB13444 TaxID=1314778 RepID=A0A5C3PF65_9APHY|nr:hypothetical protein K466DRAFT_108544 [Polyporus arcularius HHB13444]